MLKLIRSTILISFTEVFLILILFIRNKYLAVNIGTEGFGTFSLLNSFFNLMLVFCVTWLGGGALKYISEFKRETDKSKLNAVINFSLTLTILLSILFTLFFIVFKFSIKKYFISNEINDVFYLLFALAFPFLALKSILSSYLQGFILIKSISYLRIVTSIIEVLLIFICIYFFHLLGFFISLLFSSIIIVSFYFFEFRKTYNFFKPNLNFKNQISKKILIFGAYNLTSGFTNFFSQYLQRVIILRMLNLGFVGIFQAGYSLMGYMGILNRGLNFYYLPKMSEKLSLSNRNELFNQFLRLTMMFGMPLYVICILFSKNLIQLLYSKSFLGLSEYLYLFIIASFLINLEGGLQSIIIGMVYLKMHVLIGLVTNAIWVIIPLLLLKNFGIYSLGLSFILGSITSSFIMYFYLHKKLAITFNRNFIFQFLFSILFLLLSIQLMDSQLYIKVMLLFSCILGLLLFIKKNEWSKLIFYVNGLLKIKL